MMKRFKKMAALLFALCFMLAFSACSGGNDEYERLSGFEYHFYPEEYEEEYSKITREVELESGKDYKLLIQSVCESGSIKITATYAESDDTVYFVNSDSPCEEWIELPIGTTERVNFTINIEADTEGFVIVDVLAR